VKGMCVEGERLGGEKSEEERAALASGKMCRSR